MGGKREIPELDQLELSSLSDMSVHRKVVESNINLAEELTKKGWRSLGMAFLSLATSVGAAYLAGENSLALPIVCAPVGGTVIWTLIGALRLKQGAEIDAGSRASIEARVRFEGND